MVGKNWLKERQIERVEKKVKKVDNMLASVKTELNRVHKTLKILKKESEREEDER